MTPQTREAVTVIAAVAIMSVTAFAAGQLVGLAVCKATPLVFGKKSESDKK